VPCPEHVLVAARAAGTATADTPGTTANATAAANTRGRTNRRDIVLSLRKSAAPLRAEGLETGRRAGTHGIRPAEKVASRRDRSNKPRRWQSKGQVTAVR